MEFDDKELVNEIEKRFLEHKKTLKKLQDLNQKLQNANRKLEESEALKSHFIANISNEIENPFSSIIGLSKNILLANEENWDKAQQMVELIHSQAFNLDFQLKNIFVAAKIEAGEIKPEYVNVDIHNIIYSLFEDFKYEAQKKNINFNLIKTGDNNFISDPEKIKLIISNLISNAIKFSFENKRVEVSLKIDKKKLILSVQDFGTGISEENQKVIKDRFKRIDSGIRSDQRGHGLGLSINKALMDALKGKIDFSTTENVGTKFQIELTEPNIKTSDYATDGNEFLFESD